MTSSAIYRRVKVLIKERVPFAERMVRWLRPEPTVEVLQAPIPRPPWMPADNLREQLSREFIRGQGLEIGALYNPVFVKPGVQVKYVDWETTEAMREQVRQLPYHQDALIVNVDIVDDGDTLASVGESTQDFIIANHFLEHVQDPIGTIKRHLEILKPGGVLYYGIPDKRFTFDRQRPVTTLEHHYRDHEEGPAWSLDQHVEEYVALAENKTGSEGRDRIAELMKLPRLGIHFHVWTIQEVTEMLMGMWARYQMPFEIEAIVCNRSLVETICVLRKSVHGEAQRG